MNKFIVATISENDCLIIDFNGTVLNNAQCLTMPFFFIICNSKGFHL